MSHRRQFLRRGYAEPGARRPRSLSEPPVATGRRQPGQKSAGDSPVHCRSPRRRPVARPKPRRSGPRRPRALRLPVDRCSSCLAGRCPAAGAARRAPLRRAAHGGTVRGARPRAAPAPAMRCKSRRSAARLKRRRHIRALQAKYPQQLGRPPRRLPPRRPWRQRRVLPRARGSLCPSEQAISLLQQPEGCRRQLLHPEKLERLAA